MYLVGAGRKKAGRYDEAAELYRQALAADPQDAVARNNLANIEFARGGYDAASARYRAGTSSTQPAVAATSHYNLSLAHLQKFDYQAYNAAKSNADRIAPGLVADYDRWKYDTGEYAVVDLGLGTRAGVREVRGRRVGRRGAQPGAGRAAAAAERRCPGRCLNRFVASLAIFALAGFVVARWRGRKAVHAALPALRHGLLPALPPGAR